MHQDNGEIGRLAAGKRGNGRVGGGAGGASATTGIPRSSDGSEKPPEAVVCGSRG
jgi:hypothetical protein